MNKTNDMKETIDLNSRMENTNFTHQDLQMLFNSYKNYSNRHDLTYTSNLREIVVIISYSIVVIVSIFGNLLVCNIVRRASMRRTTYIFIANLALSDLLMTVLNIPFNVARVLLDNWPFGGFMCSFVPLVQTTSVYVSTFTMMFIALDRYRVICKPLMPRLSPLQALKVIGFIWFLALILSLPHAVFNRVKTMFSYRPLIRCRSVYPENMSQWITLVTVATQYVLPLSITGMAYFFIIAKVWSRNVLGVVTEAQLIKQTKAKRKTITMLVVVVIIFALCWLPLNVYHLVNEFATVRYKSLTVYFICHWLAMSSVCCNPFIYCWLNKNFRSGAVSCFLCIRNVGRKLNSSFRSTREIRLTDIRCDISSQSRDSDSMQKSRDTACCCKASTTIQPNPISLGSLKEFSKDSIQAKPITVTVYSKDAVSMFAEIRKNEYYSLQEIKSVASDSKQGVRKSFSWNQ